MTWLPWHAMPHSKPRNRDADLAVSGRCGRSRRRLEAYDLRPERAARVNRLLEVLHDHLDIRPLHNLRMTNRSATAHMAPVRWAFGGGALEPNSRQAGTAPRGCGEVSTPLRRSLSAAHAAQHLLLRHDKQRATESDAQGSRRNLRREGIPCGLRWIGATCSRRAGLQGWVAEQRNCDKGDVLVAREMCLLQVALARRCLLQSQQACLKMARGRQAQQRLEDLRRASLRFATTL